MYIKIRFQSILIVLILSYISTAASNEPSVGVDLTNAVNQKIHEVENVVVQFDKAAGQTIEELKRENHNELTNHKLENIQAIESNFLSSMVDKLQSLIPGQHAVDGKPSKATVDLDATQNDQYQSIGNNGVRSGGVTIASGNNIGKITGVRGGGVQTIGGNAGFEGGFGYQEGGVRSGGVTIATGQNIGDITSANGGAVQSIGGSGANVIQDGQSFGFQNNIGGQPIGFQSSSQSVGFQRGGQSIGFQNRGEPFGFQSGQSIAFQSNGQPMGFQSGSQSIGFQNKGQLNGFQSGQSIAFQSNGQSIGNQGGVIGSGVLLVNQLVIKVLLVK